MCLISDRLDLPSTNRAVGRPNCRVVFDLTLAQKGKGRRGNRLRRRPRGELGESTECVHEALVRCATSLTLIYCEGDAQRDGQVSIVQMGVRAASKPAERHISSNRTPSP